MRRAAPLLAAVCLGGCAYFNGIYNARQAEKRGDHLLQRGRESEAAGFYATAAAKAETVLVRHRKSRWAEDARYIAGRGWALANQCDRAVPLLESSLTSLGSRTRRDRAVLALGMCYVRQQRFAAGRDTLRPLTRARDRWVANQASIWAARAAIGLGENDSALVFLRSASTASAEWELADAYLSQGRYAAAESLLTMRAADGDFRPDVLLVLRRLWVAGRQDGVAGIVRRYDSSRLHGADRARVHLALGDLLLAAGRDSAALAEFRATQRAGRDSAVGREAAARIALVALRGPAALADVEGIVARSRDAAQGVPLQQRLADNLLFVKMLAARTDYTGSSLFLAGEVARDSLRAYALAHGLFKRVVADFPRAAVAAKALLAAADLEPDSAETYYARLRAEYPASPFTLALDGRDNSALDAENPADRLLEQAWTAASKAFADSLVALRRARTSGQAPVAASTPPAATAP